MQKKHVKRPSIDDIHIDLDKPFIDPNLPEINDVRGDRFGVPLSKYYIECEPNFEKARKKRAGQCLEQSRHLRLSLVPKC